LGLRSLRLSEDHFELRAATADLPAIAPWRARPWPGPFEEHRYETIAALDDLIVADRRQVEYYDEPFRPAGFTIWRAPGGRARRIGMKASGAAPLQPNVACAVARGWIGQEVRVVHGAMRFEPSLSLLDVAELLADPAAVNRPHERPPIP
jgi:hypothetical protein